MLWFERYQFDLHAFGGRVSCLCRQPTPRIWCRQLAVSVGGLWWKRVCEWLSLPALCGCMNLAVADPYTVCKL